MTQPNQSISVEEARKVSPEVLNRTIDVLLSVMTPRQVDQAINALRWNADWKSPATGKYCYDRGTLLLAIQLIEASR